MQHICFQYNGSSWAEIQKFKADDAESNDYSGRGVGVSGNHIIVGSWWDDDNGTTSGSAYFYEPTPADTYTPQAMDACDSTQINGNWYSVTQVINDTFSITTCQDSIVTTDLTISSCPDEHCEIQKVTAFDGVVDDNYGISVSISGNTALVGSKNDDDNGSNSGSAYFYSYNGSTWAFQQKVTASDGAALDLFGENVAVSGNYAVIGAQGDDDNGSNSGSAYVFYYNGANWIEFQKITSSDGVADDHFGFSVAISGNNLIVGVDADDDNGTGSGSAYIFSYNGASWIEQQKILASDGAASDIFGTSVDIHGDLAIVGASGNDDLFSNSGSAYVFEYDGSSWSEQQKIVPADVNTSSSVGVSASIGEDLLMIGARGDNDNGAASGAAYIYEFNGASWVLQQKLTASDGASGDFLGRSVAISGNVAVSGANGNDDIGSSSGSVYFYYYNGSSWVEQKVLSSDIAATDFFGARVAISGDNILVSSYLDDDNGSASGSVYFFEPSPGDIYTPQVIDGCDSIQINGTWYAATQVVNDTISIGTCQDSIVTTDLTISNCAIEDYCEFQKLSASDGILDDNLGLDVDISGNWAIASAQRADGNASNSGGAYVFRYNGTTWLEDQEISTADGNTDEFLAQVAISDDVLALGSSSDDDLGSNIGSGYIFRYNGTNWIEEQKLTPTDGQAQDLFGYSADISGNIAVFGAIGDDDNGSQSGSVYVFHYDGIVWMEIQKLTASDAAFNDRFGWDVSIAGDKIVVGADEGSGSNGNGKAYVFVYNGTSWVEEQILTAFDGALDDFFGSSVSITEDWLVIGARADDDVASGAGSAYVYQYNGSNWIFDQKLTAYDAAASDVYGTAVSMSGNKIIIGAYADDDNGSTSGSFYLYYYDGANWNEHQKFIASDGKRMIVLHRVPLYLEIK